MLHEVGVYFAPFLHSNFLLLLAFKEILDAHVSRWGQVHHSGPAARFHAGTEVDGVAPDIEGEFPDTNYARDHRPSIQSDPQLPVYRARFGHQSNRMSHFERGKH